MIGLLPLCAKVIELNKKVKVGVVSYLNARPLLYGLQKSEMEPYVELIEDNPAALARKLMDGEIDLGLIPVAVIPRLPEHHIVGNYCIGAEGEVATVCLFSEVPLEEIETVYLDYQSRTSVALLQWLMKEYWGIAPNVVHAKDESYREKINGTTAGLVIGNRAFEQRKVSTFIYDLGSEWKKITGLPFVFAAWVSTKKLSDDFIERFDASNALGLNHIDEIAAAENFSLYDLKKYFHNQISYELTERKRKGMDLFLQYLHETVIV